MRRTLWCGLMAACCAMAGPALAQPGLEYVAVEPCRVADTRQSAEGVIDADTVRNFRVTGSAANLAAQGGEVNCPNPRPDQPVAVAAYLIAISTPDSGNGNLLAFPSNEAPASGSTVNYKATGNIGNTSIVSLCTTGSCPAGGPLGIRSNFSEQHVVVDIQGYFYQAGHGVALASENDPVDIGPDPVDVIDLSMDIPAAGVVQLSFSSSVVSASGVDTSCSLALDSEGAGPAILNDVAYTSIGSTSFVPLGFTRGFPVEPGTTIFTVQCRRAGGPSNSSMANINLSAVYSSNSLAN